MALTVLSLTMVYQFLVFHSKLYIKGIEGVTFITTSKMTASSFFLPKQILLFPSNHCNEDPERGCGFTTNTTVNLCKNYSECS